MIRFPAVVRDLSPHQSRQTGRGIHRASYSVQKGDFSLGVSHAGCEINHSPLSVDSCLNISYAFMASTGTISLLLISTL